MTNKNIKTKYDDALAVLNNKTLADKLARKEFARRVGKSETQELIIKAKTRECPACGTAVDADEVDCPECGKMVGKANVKQIPLPEELDPDKIRDDAEELSARMMGKNLEVVGITSTWLDEWEYSVEVSSDSFRQKNKALDMALANEKLQTVVQVFPEIFAANKEEFFREFMATHGSDAEKYLQKQAQESSPQIESVIPNLSTGQTKISSQLKSSMSSLGALTGAST